MTEPANRTATDLPTDPPTAVVTGGAHGIGLGYGRKFAAAGYRVVLVDVDPVVVAVAEKLPDHDRLSHHGMVVDVASETDVQRLADRVAADGGKVQVLINNAALMLRLARPFKPFEETSWQEWQRVFDVNVGGVFLMTRALLPALKAAAPSSVINIGSDAVWKGYDGQLAYFASKGSIQTITRCLARELGPFDIRVNCIAPGFTLSESVRDNEVMRSVSGLVRESQAIKRDQYPEDVADTALFLASAAAQCITGQTVVVNCGAVMP